MPPPDEAAKLLGCVCCMFSVTFSVNLWVLSFLIIGFITDSWHPFFNLRIGSACNVVFQRHILLSKKAWFALFVKIASFYTMMQVWRNVGLKSRTKSGISVWKVNRHMPHGRVKLKCSSGSNLIDTVLLQIPKHRKKRCENVMMEHHLSPGNLEMISLPAWPMKTWRAIIEKLQWVCIPWCAGYIQVGCS
jgi:hypothetical protein